MTTLAVYLWGIRCEYIFALRLCALAKAHSAFLPICSITIATKIDSLSKQEKHYCF